MTNPENAEALWQRILASLEQRGQLPDNKETLTPAEIAAWAEKTFADPRLSQFVSAYYYPIRYGDMDGAMSETDVMALVNDLERYRLKPNRIVMELVDDTTVENCELCGRDITAKAHMP